MVSALVSGSSGPGSSPGRGHCVVFLGKTLYSHSTSLHLDCSQPSIFSYFYSIVERPDVIARELDASAKRRI